MSVKAIETRYAGCQFRSRLEARWAVFFDNLDIRWEYEPQGFTSVFGTPYLPDFHLPGDDLWVEVKGRRDPSGVARAIEVVDHGALPGYGLVLLGSIPRPVRDGLPAFPVLVYHEGVLHEWASFSRGSAWSWGRRGGAWTAHWDASPIPPIAPFAHRVVRPEDILSPRVNRALEAARSARFEHGETP